MLRLRESPVKDASSPDTSVVAGVYGENPGQYGLVNSDTSKSNFYNRLNNILTKNIALPDISKLNNHKRSNSEDEKSNDKINEPASLNIDFDLNYYI